MHPLETKVLPVGIDKLPQPRSNLDGLLRQDKTDGVIVVEAINPFWPDVLEGEPS
jgi:hypothetical protein